MTGNKYRRRAPLEEGRNGLMENHLNYHSSAKIETAAAAVPEERAEAPETRRWNLAAGVVFGGIGRIQPGRLLDSSNAA